jgi:hypothetical protein
VHKLNAMKTCVSNGPLITVLQLVGESSILPSPHPQRNGICWKLVEPQEAG